MAKLIFRLRGVPDDEAREVRELLDQHDVDYYETSAGNWGMSMPGLWLVNNSEKDHVKMLIDDYQGQRVIRVRAERAERETRGERHTLWQEFCQQPVRFVVYLAFSLGLLYMMLSPWFWIG